MDKYLSNKIKNISLILTFLVVVLHAYNLESSKLTLSINYFIQNFISYGICTVAVPMFFMISGYLFFYKFNPTLKGWINKYKKRFKSLVIPFVIWCLGWMIVLYLVQLTSFGRMFFSNMIVSDFSIKQLFEYTFKYPIPFQLWYISDLIKLVIISPIIYYLVRFLEKIYIPIIIVLCFINIINFPIIFFSLGCYMALNYPKLNFKVNRSVFRLVVIGFLICSVLRVFTLNNINYIGESLLAITRILGILSIWFGYDFIAKGYDKVFKIAEYGIFIYFFHEPFQSFFYRVTFKLINKTEVSQFILYFVTPILTIIISVSIAIIFKRYMKNIYCILTGGR